MSDYCTLPPDAVFVDYPAIQAATVARLAEFNAEATEAATQARLRAVELDAAAAAAVPRPRLHGQPLTPQEAWQRAFRGPLRRPEGAA